MLFNTYFLQAKILEESIAYFRQSIVTPRKLKRVDSGSSNTPSTLSLAPSTYLSPTSTSSVYHLPISPSSHPSTHLFLTSSSTLPSSPPHPPPLSSLPKSTPLPALPPPLTALSLPTPSSKKAPLSSAIPTHPTSFSSFASSKLPPTLTSNQASAPLMLAPKTITDSSISAQHAYVGPSTKYTPLSYPLSSQPTSRTPSFSSQHIDGQPTPIAPQQSAPIVPLVQPQPPSLPSFSSLPHLLIAPRSIQPERSPSSVSTNPSPRHDNQSYSPPDLPVAPPPNIFSSMLHLPFPGPQETTYQSTQSRYNANGRAPNGRMKEYVRSEAYGGGTFVFPHPICPPTMYRNVEGKDGLQGALNAQIPRKFPRATPTPPVISKRRLEKSSSFTLSIPIHPFAEELSQAASSVMGHYSQNHSSQSECAVIPSLPFAGLVAQAPVGSLTSAVETAPARMCPAVVGTKVAVGQSYLRDVAAGAAATTAASLASTYPPIDITGDQFSLRMEEDRRVNLLDMRSSLLNLPSTLSSSRRKNDDAEPPPTEPRRHVRSKFEKVHSGLDLSRNQTDRQCLDQSLEKRASSWSNLSIQYDEKHGLGSGKNDVMEKMPPPFNDHLAKHPSFGEKELLQELSTDQGQKYPSLMKEKMDKDVPLLNDQPQSGPSDDAQEEKQKHLPLTKRSRFLWSH